MATDRIAGTAGGRGEGDPAGVAGLDEVSVWLVRTVADVLGAPAEELRWRYGPAGKPELTGRWTGVHVNLSPTAATSPWSSCRPPGRSAWTYSSWSRTPTRAGWPAGSSRPLRRGSSPKAAAGAGRPAASPSCGPARRRASRPPEVGWHARWRYRYTARARSSSTSRPAGTWSATYRRRADSAPPWL